MATKSVTSRATFERIPAVSADLFEVREGIDTFYALSNAECLVDSVTGLLTTAVAMESMDASTAFLCRFALNAAEALRVAAGEAA